MHPPPSAGRCTGMVHRQPHKPPLPATLQPPVLAQTDTPCLTTRLVQAGNPRCQWRIIVASGLPCKPPSHPRDHIHLGARVKPAHASLSCLHAVEPTQGSSSTPSSPGLPPDPADHDPGHLGNKPGTASRVAVLRRQVSPSHNPTYIDTCHAIRCLAMTSSCCMKAPRRSSSNRSGHYFASQQASCPPPLLPPSSLPPSASPAASPPSSPASLPRCPSEPLLLPSSSSLSSPLSS